MINYNSQRIIEELYGIVKWRKLTIRRRISEKKVESCLRRYENSKILPEKETYVNDCGVGWRKERIRWKVRHIHHLRYERKLRFWMIL